MQYKQVILIGIVLVILATPLSVSAGWQKIRENVADVQLARDQIDGLSKVFIVDQASGDVYLFDGLNRWKNIGGPGSQFVVGISNAGTALYGLTPGKDAVYRYKGKAEWGKVGGPAKMLYGGHGGLYALSPKGNELYSYNPGTGKWVNIGGGGKTFAVGGGNELYGISPDGSGVYRYTGTPHKWERIWNHAQAIYSAPGHLYATDAAGVYRYNNKPFSWTKIGGPGRQFTATGDGSLYGLSPDGKSISQYLGIPGNWQRIGAEARSIHATKNDLYILKNDGSLWVQKQVVPPQKADTFSIVNFLIITIDDALAKAVKEFADHKEKHGYSTTVVTLSEVYRSAYGVDEAEKIRNYLMSAYQHGGLRYVLLVGDVDKIPTKVFFREDGVAQNNAYLTDYYYADMHTMDWDLDDDGRWGEIPNEIDMKHDIVVSRLPFNDAATVRLVTRNMIEFQNSAGESWQQRIILAHGYMDKAHDLAEDAEAIVRDIIVPNGFLADKLYVKSGKTTSEHFDEESVTPLGDASYQSLLKPKGHGLVLLAAHGATDSMVSWYLNDDDKNDNIYFGTYHGVKNSDVSGIIMLNGCNTAPTIASYDTLDAELNNNLSTWSSIGKKVHGNIAKQYLKNGAVAVVATTAGSEYGSQKLEYEFAQQLISNKRTVGDAFVMAKEEAGNQRDYHVFYLMGDPTLKLY